MTRPCEHEYPSTGTFEDLICVRCGHRKSPHATDARPMCAVCTEQQAHGLHVYCDCDCHPAEQATGTRVTDFVDEIIAERGQEFAERVEYELKRRRWQHRDTRE